MVQDKKKDETAVSSTQSSPETSSSSSMAIPDQWPPEVAASFDPIRKLGQGGYASVLLCRRRNKSEHTEEDDWVAMKIVGTKNLVTRLETAYAHREIQILREVCHHPNIVKVLQSWEPQQLQQQNEDTAAVTTGNGNQQKCAAVIAMEYVRGPTLHALLMKGGALSMNCARVVSAQLVDVVLYLHSRAVVHRDIKPDNIIITGADMTTQDELWDDKAFAAAYCNNNKETDWKALVKKWHVTLIDFGFSRALTPRDVAKGPTKSQREMAAKQAGIVSDGGDGLGHSQRSLTASISKSISRRFDKQMSCVGNRAYAAPEIQKVEKNPKRVLREYSKSESIDMTEVYSEYIASYGLLADAYSVGNTIKHMVTGVRPDLDVNDFIASQTTPIALLCTLLCALGSKKNKETGETNERVVKYRGPNAIPGDVLRLIRSLTHPDAQQRSSLRYARLYPWIDDVLETDMPEANKVEYLSFVLNNDSHNGVEQSTAAAAAAAVIVESEDTKKGQEEQLPENNTMAHSAPFSSISHDPFEVHDTAENEEIKV